jgi:hypothetical protein
LKVKRGSCPKRGTPLLRQFFLAPACQSLANVCGIKLQNTADIFKAEDPIRATLENPSACVVENPFARSAPRRMIILKALNGIFQYREHKSLLSFEGRFPMSLIEKLLSQTGVGLKPRRDFFSRVQANVVYVIRRTRSFGIHRSVLLIQSGT